MKHLISLLICLLLAFGAISCDDVVSSKSTALNQSQLQGKWLIMNAYVITGGEYIRVYDTLEISENKYLRTDYSNTYPCTCLSKGAFMIKSDIIQFSGYEYTVDASRLVIDSSANAFNWRAELANDSTLTVKGEMGNEDQRIVKLNQ